jgi:predicted nucleic acid-binding protein
MRAIDASSLIYAWDNYPPSQFPRLWEWIASEIEAGNLYIANAAFAEVGHKLPECVAWLVECKCTVVTETHEVLQATSAIKQVLGLERDNFHADGVDENDVLIIATAKTRGQTLISNESRQPLLPQDMRRWKIPAVCGHEAVGVMCSSFVEYFKASGKIF